MELHELVKKIRNRLADYRFARKDREVSTHLNAVEIAICLVEFALQDNRKIRMEEENWFRADYYVQIVLENSEWEDISDMYMQLVDMVEEKNFFR